MPNSVIGQLRKQISAIEQNLLAEGSDASDQNLPWNNIRAGSLLEIQPESYPQRSAAAGATLAFGAQLLRKRTGPLIWCQLRDPERFHLHAPGLMAFGLDPERMIKLTVKNEKDLLWAMEEALSCSYICGVIGVLWKEKLYDFTASRRLLLRARENDVSALMLRSHHANGTTAADIRLGVSSRTSSKMPAREKFLPRLGNTSWQFDLKKGKGINHGNWQIGWNRKTLSLDLDAGLSDRTPLPQSPTHASQRHAI